MDQSKETGERADKFFKENQSALEEAIMRKAESEILISRLRRDQSDLDIRIKVLEGVLARAMQPPPPAEDPNPSPSEN